MMTNGSESLNNVFIIAQWFMICALMEKTLYKCVEWFIERRGVGVEWQDQGQDTQRK
jgi:hypothetical protein